MGLILLLIRLRWELREQENRKPAAAAAPAARGAFGLRYSLQSNGNTILAGGSGGCCELIGGLDAGQSSHGTISNLDRRRCA